MRPIADVVRDLEATERLPWHKRRTAMLYDNNLGGDIDYAKELLREMAKLDLLAWGAQFSFDCLHDTEFVDLLAASHCRMAFIGMESLNDLSLAHVHKTHNHVNEYRELFGSLRRRGVLVFAGLMFGLDADTPEYLAGLAGQLQEASPEVLLMSIAIPIPGTPWHREVAAEGRIVDHDLAHYEGDHLVFRPRLVSPTELLTAYRENNRRFFAHRAALGRWLRFLKAQPAFGMLPRRVLGTLISSAIYFKLTAFQRHHAQRRVFDATSGETQQAGISGDACPL
jgi:radical SAM superfamily enzyme YgiQ (UPF0313 family)